MSHSNITRKKRIQAARLELQNYRGETRKVVVDIAGLTHAEVGQILFGGPWGQLKMLCRYTLSVALALCPFPEFKNRLFRLMGVSIGRNVYIAPLVYLDVTRPDLLHIGDNVMVGMGTALAVHERNMQFLALGKVVIENGSTIGGQCLVRCGVRIGEGAVVEAHCCVVRDLKPGECGRGERSELSH